MFAMPVDFSSQTAGHPQNPAAVIAELAPWFHNLHLPGGLQTAPDHSLGDFPRNKWLQIRDHLPSDLTQWRVLDIGCNAGFYSFALAQRGAAVTAIDTNAHYLHQARWAATRYDFPGTVQFKQMSIYELHRDPQRYDLVLFMGLFYHLRHPLLALDVVARKVKRMMVFQTMTIPGQTVFNAGPDRALNDRDDLLNPGWPKMAFIENAMAGDPTNWWLINHAGVLALLRSSGLRLTDRPAREIYFCEPGEMPNDGMDWAGEELRAVFGE